MQFLQDHLSLILGVALGISESLALIPSLQSNSILTFIVNALKSLEGKSGSTPASK